MCYVPVTGRVQSYKRKQPRKKKVFQTDEEHKNRVKPNETAMNTIALLECVWLKFNTHIHCKPNQIPFTFLPTYFTEIVRFACSFHLTHITHTHAHIHPHANKIHRSKCECNINNQGITMKTKPKLYSINSTKVAVQWCALLVYQKF